MDFLDFFFLGLWWRTNRILEALLEQKRRQMLSPQERAAEDKAEAEAEEARIRANIRTAAWGVVAALVIVGVVSLIH